MELYFSDEIFLSKNHLARIIKNFLIEKELFIQIHAEELVSSIQSVFRELSDIKKSLSQNESGPIGVKSAAQHLEVSQQKIYLEVEEGDIPHYQDRPGVKYTSSERNLISG